MKELSNLWVLLNQLNSQIKSSNMLDKSTQYYVRNIPSQLSPYSPNKISVYQAIHLINLGCSLAKINNPQSKFVNELVTELSPHSIYTDKESLQEIIAQNNLQEYYVSQEKVHAIMEIAHKIAPIL